MAKTIQYRRASSCEWVDLYHVSAGDDERPLVKLAESMFCDVRVRFEMGGRHGNA